MKSWHGEENINSDGGKNNCNKGNKVENYKKKVDIYFKCNAIKQEIKTKDNDVEYVKIINLKPRLSP